jgi:hypothetical protein
MKFLLDLLKMMLEGKEVHLPSKPLGIERVAPFGNRTQKHPASKTLTWLEWLYRELPHYHRRKFDEKGNVLPGQGLTRHRPWESSRFDKKTGDRFYSTKKK